MKIKALAPWFGSKRNLAPTIVKLMGEHRVYWEPFCGSMAVLLAKPPCEMETVNDLHGDLINLAKVIQDKELGFQLYDKLSRTLYAEQLFREAKERWISGDGIYGAPDIDRAYDYFVASWMGINGFSGTKRNNYQFALRWCVGGGQGATRWMNVVGSVPAWHKRIQNVVIINRDAFKILENIKDETGVAIYIDPPYFIFDKGSKYTHDFEDENHVELRDLLDRFKKARVIVSYYDHPKVEMLYMGWNKILMKKKAQSLRNASRDPINKPKNPPVEAILTNFIPNQGGLFDV